ncbi:MAG: ABC transporter permease subunit [Clostridiales bacterium]
MINSFMKNSFKKLYININIIFILVWIIIWWIISLTVDSFFMPSPFETFKILTKLLVESTTYIIVGMTIIRIVIGLFSALLLGIILGIFSASNKIIFRFLQPIMVAVKSTPVASFIIIAMVYMNIIYVPIFCGFLLCLPIIYYNVIEGMEVIDKEMISMALLYKVPKKRLIMKIYIPSIMPYINAALLTAVGICWKGTIAAEVIGVVKNSIGYKIYNAKVYLETGELFSWTIIIITCSMIIESIIKGIIRKSKYYKGMKVI